MLHEKFFLLTQLLLPFFCYCVMKFFLGNSPSAGFFYRASPLLFLVNLLQLTRLENGSLTGITFFESFSGASIGIISNKTNLGFCWVLGIIWLITTFYIEGLLEQKNWQENLPKKMGDTNEAISRWLNAWEMKSMLILFFAILNLLVLSKNLFTLFFAQTILMLTSQVLARNFLQKNEDQNFESNQPQSKFNKGFYLPFLLYLQNFLLFLAIVGTFKINGNLSFDPKNSFPNFFENTTYCWLLALYFGGTFLLIMAPFYFFAKKLKFSEVPIYLLFFLFLGFGNSISLIKILNHVFGIEALQIIIGEEFEVDKMLILFNLVIFSVMLIFAKNLRSAIFYLLFHQISFLIFSILSLSLENSKLVFPAIIGFCCNFSAAFFSTSNISIFEKKTSENQEIEYLNEIDSAQNSNFSGNADFLEQSSFNCEKIKSAKNQIQKLNLGKAMPLNCSMLFFALIAMTGIAPSISCLQMIGLVAKIWHDKSLISAIILLVNFISLAVFAAKFFRNSWPRDKQANTIQSSKKSDQTKTMQSDIEQNSKLTLSPLILLLIGLFSIFFTSLFKEIF